MATTKKHYFVTTACRASYPHLNVADTAFNSEGVYRVSLVPDSFEELENKVKEAAEEKFGPKATYRVPWTKDEGTGEISIKVKSKYPPAFVDSKGDEIPEEKKPKIFGGSIIRCRGQINAYDVLNKKGVNLQLHAVQIISLAKGSPMGSGGGFDAVEGGYVQHDANEVTIEDFEDAPEISTQEVHDSAARF